MLPQVTSPKLINKYGQITINNVVHDPCEYLRFIYNQSPYLRDKIAYYHVLIKYCNEPIHVYRKNINTNERLEK